MLLYLQEHEERKPESNLIQQGGGAFVVSIPRAPDPAPPKNEFYLQGPSKHADHARKELMSALSVRVRNLCVN
jgi:hypothetical protein